MRRTELGCVVRIGWRRLSLELMTRRLWHVRCRSEAGHSIVSAVAGKLLLSLEFERPREAVIVAKDLTWIE